MKGEPQVESRLTPAVQRLLQEMAEDWRKIQLKDAGYKQ